MDNFQPTVVIGIGGTGKNILLSLKKMIMENSVNGMADYPLLKLFSIDTDVNPCQYKITSDIETVKDEFQLDPNTESLRLGADGIVSTPNLDNFPQIKEWFPGTEVWHLNPNDLVKGASQMKPVGRFSFAWNAQKIRDRLYGILSTTVDTESARRNHINGSNLKGFTNVFICGSISGGTGSGTFLDMANMVRFVAKQAGITVKVYGILALASIYDHVSIGSNLRPNCYASLVELDHFMNPDTFNSPKRMFYPAYRDVGPNDWDYTNSSNYYAFDYPYIFDKTNEDGLSFTDPVQFAQMAARFIYLLSGSDVANGWESAESNLQIKPDRALNKPVRYRAMGNTAVIYPRRKISQLCAFKLASEYFKEIFNDSYGTVEIGRLVDRFLNDTKTNGENEYLEESFSMFKTGNGNEVVPFSEFLEDQKDGVLEEAFDLVKNEKKEILRTIDVWQEDMNNYLSRFKLENSVAPRDMKPGFMNSFKKRISDLLDLRTVEDTANPLQDGSKRMVRGSIVRARDFTAGVLAKYIKFEEVYHKKEDESKSAIGDLKDTFEEKLEELKGAIGSVIPSEKKIKSCLEETCNAYVEFLNAQKDQIVAGLIRQFFNEITDVGGTHLAEGVIKELQDIKLNLDNGIIKLKKVAETTDDFIFRNKAEATGSFCVEVFDYKKDVENMFNSLMDNKDFGKEQIYTALSNSLKEKDAFGEDYSRVGSSLASPAITNILLRASEKFFFEPVSNVNIRKRLLEEPDKLDALVHGTYLANAKVYVKLNGEEMSRSGMDLKGKVYYAMSIPNESEYQRYCSGLNGVSDGKPFSCPFDEGGELANSEEVCPLYSKNECLKSKILKSATSDLSIVYSEDMSEINILKIATGFPLRAVTSINGQYREEYMKKIREQNETNRMNGTNEEVVHMFGPVKFADLNEKEERPQDLSLKFKKYLLMALAVRRLELDLVGVKFYTEKDVMNDRDEPSLYLGRDFAEAAKLAESLRFDDITKVDEVEKSVAAIVESADTPERKEKCWTMLKETYSAYMQKLPAGFTEDDLDLLDQLAIDICGKTVKEAKVKRNIFD